tara:strand:- start:22 stop:390 length:369 start_codon:yes stop_codon:yes gene_type:complete
MGDYALVLTLILLVVLSSGCSTNTYGTWSESEQKKYKYYLAMQAVDTIQTSKVTDNGNLVEMNPLYGKTPTLETILLVKGLTNLMVYASLTHVNDRGNTLNIMNTGITLVLINNQIEINRAF